MDVASLTIDEFLTRLASSDPTPGGGSLAALTGAMAAAMLAMVCNLTIGRPKYADVEPEVRALLEALQGRQVGLVDLANADVRAYGAVRDAYRLPRGTEEERSARTAAIDGAMEHATAVPVQIAEDARTVLDLALRASRSTNVAALGDVAVGAHLALAAARGAADQARLNLSTLHDAAFATALAQRLSAALADADGVATQTLETVQARASGG